MNNLRTSLENSRFEAPTSFALVRRVTNFLLLSNQGEYNNLEAAKVQASSVRTPVLLVYKRIEKGFRCPKQSMP